MMYKLTTELQELQSEMKKIAEDYGLDFPRVIFEMLDYKQMNQFSAYTGFPIRYPHWSFGMEYHEMSRSYAYGLHRIYEMVINTDPCYAYLLTSNQIVDQKLVMLHVFGHADFFKNNLWFKNTNRKMLDEMANHASRIWEHVDEYGFDVVEKFIDTCLSLENLIDPHSMGIKRIEDIEKDEDIERDPDVGRLKAKSYMDPFINPAEYIKRQKEEKIKKSKELKERFPKHSTRDVLEFLLTHAPLDNWQRDILGIIREEAYYFIPQRQTKILNEGWASFIHSKLMTEKALTDQELIDYAEHHSGTVAIKRGRLNPYAIGLKLLRDIENRWNRGAFGREWEECESREERKSWDKKLGLGKQKVFEVRRNCNDIGFIDGYLTEDFVRENGLFTYEYDPITRLYKISSRDFKKIKRAILDQLTNSGYPIVELIDANHKNQGELLLNHVNRERPLDENFTKGALKALFNIWKRPVNILTEDDDSDMTYRVAKSGTSIHREKPKTHRQYDGMWGFYKG